MKNLKKNLPGILTCFIIAVPSWLLGKKFPIIGGAVIAILIGMILSLFWYQIYIKIYFADSSCSSRIWNEFKRCRSDRKTISSYYCLYNFDIFNYCMASSQSHENSGKHRNLSRSRFINLWRLCNSCNSPCY